MDPGKDDWHTCKNELIDETQNVGNITRSWQWRELGIDPPHSPSNKSVLENIAEDILVQKNLSIKCCDLPGYPRSTFLMVFSPDGTKVASTHGNHNVYVSELASGKHVRILKGHPRTPWCIAFHPSHPELIGSGCLGGQVRVWDISSGGSEVWKVENETVIASIAFHPREQLLVIATYNELYFWDWSQPSPFTKVSTNNFNEKVRYVAFDALGYKLITGISLWTSSVGAVNRVQLNPTASPTANTNNNGRDDSGDSSVPGSSRTQDNSGTTQDMIVNSYQNLVQRYDTLVRNYQRLYMAGRLTNTPPPPSTTDRGTDPMETDVSTNAQQSIRNAQPSTSTAQCDEGPSTSRPPEGSDSGDGEGSSSRLLNLDILSFDTDPSRSNAGSSRQEHSIFGSRSSAFQPLNSTEAGRSFRAISQNERTNRLLPNPFSSQTSLSRDNRSSNSAPNDTRESQTGENSSNTSRTSIFSPLRPELSPGRRYLMHRRNSSVLQQYLNTSHSRNSLANALDINALSAACRRLSGMGSRAASSENTPSTSTSNPSQRPRTTSSGTQMSPTTEPVDAQTINESLDLIRDILRDSGTRLLNLITNMSLSTLANVERNIPRRTSSRANPESGDSSGRARGFWPHLRFIDYNLVRNLLSSSSDSDSDQTLEVNIFRTRNSTFREEDARDENVSREPNSAVRPNITDRLVFELDDEIQNEGLLGEEGGGVNVSLSDSRFRVRTQSNLSNEEPLRNNGPNTENQSPSTSDFNRPTENQTQSTPNFNRPTENQSQSTPDFNRPTENQSQSTPDINRPTENQSQSTPDFSRPSTSRDNFWSSGDVIPSDEAFRKVRGGVYALQKHTTLLANLWLRGKCMSMRELRIMWEDLRRRILTLHRETGRQESPSYYTRSLLERCMLLSGISDNNTSVRNPRQQSDESVRNESPVASTSSNHNGSTPSETNRTTPSGNRSVPTRTPNYMRTASNLRRRLQSNYRWRSEDEFRRRTRNIASNRLSQRYPNRSRRDFARALEISATRHEIRMRAMQVLSVMFDMMMMCLEERGLSQLIITMLRTLKKALALTCLMLMTNRNIGRSNTNTTPTSQRAQSPSVIRIQNVDNSEPINVDGPDDTSVINPVAQNANRNSDNNISEGQVTDNNRPSTSQAPINENKKIDEARAASHNTDDQKWSSRLAVQIATANRNYSTTARNRRDLYIESKRLKALHRTNPTAHPLIKRKVPPVGTHRIPVLRSFPKRANVLRLFSEARNESQSSEPVAGPSNRTPPVAQESLRPDEANEFDDRVNSIRIAHMQAIRLRNAARSRFRRLQTFRLYTPSYLQGRELFTLQLNNIDEPQENSSAQNGQEPSNRLPLHSFFQLDSSGRIPFTTIRERESDRPQVDARQFQSALYGEANAPPNQDQEPQNNPDGHVNHRLRRLYETMQPLIVAQHAMIVQHNGNGSGSGGPGGSGGGGVGGGPMGRVGGMAGLLEAGIISEALPAPSHRVQAWDFTTGDTPDISNSAKNVVVQRCRIHNDASIDISRDGRLLVALLPVHRLRLRDTNHWLGVYSLEWGRLGQCLHTAVLEQTAVSVALSPTARHLAVGLGSRRFATAPHARSNVFALLYRLDALDTSSRTGISPIKELEQNWEQGFTSLNCLRWAPQPGQGLVYANNTGQLIIMS